MRTVVAFAGLPLAFFVTATGLGLLAERIARARVDDGLLAPIGFCLAVCGLLGVYRLGLGVEVAVPVLLVATLAGYLLARRDLPARLNPGWPGLAALAVYGLYVAPMILSGGWTWLGYNFLNDTSVQLLIVEHLKEFGTQAATLPPSTQEETLRTFLASGYPLGTHAYLATLSGLLAAPPEATYQAFLGAMAAMAASSFAVLGAKLGLSRPLAAGAGALALASNLALAYAYQGNIKEIGALATLSVATALGATIVRERSLIPVAVLLGLALAGVLSVYSAAGGPYVASFGLVLTLVVLVAHGRDGLKPRWFVAGAVVIAVTGVAAIATLPTFVSFARTATAVVDAGGGTGDVLGQLARPLPLLQAGGVWLDGSYQRPLLPGSGGERWTWVALVVIPVLLALSIVEIVKRRQPELLLALVPPALTAAWVAPKVAPYADAKMLAIMSPAVLFTAVFGILAVSRVWRPLGGVLAVGLALAVVTSDAFAFHDVKFAPRDRMLAIADVGEHTAGRGLVLFNEFEEFAKYFGRDAEINVSSEALTPRQVQLRQKGNLFGQFFDLDRQKLDYVTGFRTIVTRRSPGASRPPSMYRRVYRNDFYDVWEVRPGAREVRAHLPLQEGSSSGDEADCDDVRRMARIARRAPGAVLVAAHEPPVGRFEVAGAERPEGWRVHPVVDDVVIAGVPGAARGTVPVREGGPTEVWLRGDFPRRVEIFVDGRRVGSVHGVNTPGQWLRAATIDLQVGLHPVEVRLPTGRLAPGDGAETLIGPLALVPAAPERLQTVPVSKARSLCGESLDWIEVVGPGAARRPA
jgi:hypothetical protein